MNNTSGYLCSGDGLHIFSVYEVIFWFIVYFAVAALSVIGNTLVIVAVIRRKYMRNVTNYFILNLAVADGITGLLGIPFKFQAALLQRWHLPAFMCNLVPFVETVSMTVSVLLLTCIAIDRFLFVMYPRIARPSHRAAKVALGTLWTFGLLVSVPYGIGHQLQNVPEHESDVSQNSSMLAAVANQTRPLCIPHYSGSGPWRFYNLYLSILQYFVPVFLIAGAYLCIAYKLWMAPPPVNTFNRRGQLQFARSRKRVVKMLVIVVCLFTFCWLPLETYYVLSELYPCLNNYTYINVIYFCCHWLAMSDSSLNPIIYGIYNKKFRTEYRSIWRSINMRRRTKRTRRGAMRARGLKHEATQQETSLTSVCHNYIASELGQD